MSDKTFVFTCNWVAADQDGNVVETMEWNPVHRSEDGWVCPQEDCGFVLSARHLPYDGEPPTCDRYGHEGELVMVPAQIVDCVHCSEEMLARDFLGHLPLPSKITVQVLEPIDLFERFGRDPDVDEVYDYVTDLMQTTLDHLADERHLPVLG